MSQASQNIAQQFIDGGVVPTQLVGQNAVSKTYVDNQLALVSGAVSVAQSEINEHKTSTTAHAAQSITYNGEVAGANNVKQAIDSEKRRVDTIVSQSGNDITEIVDARGSYPVLGARLNAVDNSLNELSINVKRPPAPFNAAVGDGVTDDSALIQNLINIANGKPIYFPPGRYLIGSALRTGNVKIWGSGFETVLLSGTNEIVKTTNDPHDFMEIRDIKIVTTASNNGVDIHKTWTEGAVQSFSIQNVWFHAEGNQGTLLKIYGARESNLTNCWFSSNLSWAGASGSAIGVELLGDDSGGAMNIRFTNCIFMNIYQGVRGFGSADAPHLFAGFHFTNCLIIATFKGMDFANGGVLSFGDGMIDFSKNPIILRYWGGAQIHDNYIACKDESDYAVQIVPQYGTSEEIIIHSNGIYTYGDHNSSTMTARGIAIDGSLGNGNVQHCRVHDNNFRNFSEAIYIQGKGFAMPAYGNDISNNNIRNSKRGIVVDSYAINNNIKFNLFEGVATIITDVGIKTIKNGNRNGDTQGNNSGVYSTTSTATTYSYAIPHSLYAAPKTAVVNAANEQTAALGNYFITLDSSNVYVNFVNPTTAGINLKWYWSAEV